MENRQTGPEEIRKRLANLRAILPEFHQWAAREVFDEFLREYELELALHVACDYLLEPTTEAPTSELIEQIKILHEGMEIQDTCVAELEAKAQQLR
jgi:hypothetical protein